MSWSATVTDPATYPKFDVEIEERWSSENLQYVRDAALALAVAKELGLKSVTLSGGRTPIIGKDDEVVLVTITGTVNSLDFLNTMRENIAAGPGEGTEVFKHYEALSRLRQRPCMHNFTPADEHEHCTYCGVNYSKGRLWYDS